MAANHYYPTTEDDHATTSSPYEQNTSEHDDTVESLDLGAYDLDSFDAPPKSHEELSWRTDAATSLSDWTVLVTPEEDGDGDGSAHDDAAVVVGPTVAYHVHRCVLGAGRHRSEYFEALFRSTATLDDDGHRADFSEARDRTSRVPLRPSAAAAFPRMLDHVYTGQCEVDASNAVALRSLAAYFRVRTLHDETTAFLRRDMDASNAHAYLAEATVFRDERVARAAVRLCAAGFASLTTDQVRSLPPDALATVLSDDALAVPSEDLSLRIADYCRYRADEMDADLLRSVTNSLHLPSIHPSEACYLLDLDISHCRRRDEPRDMNDDDDDDDDENDDPSSLRRRCVEAVRNWKVAFGGTILSERYREAQRRRADDFAAVAPNDDDEDDGRVAAAAAGYANLPLHTKVGLLEAALVEAHEEIRVSDEHVGRLLTKNKQFQVLVNKFQFEKFQQSTQNTKLKHEHATIAAKYSQLQSELKMVKKELKKLRKFT